jgi:hypothetical protein
MHELDIARPPRSAAQFAKLFCYGSNVTERNRLRPPPASRCRCRRFLSDTEQPLHQPAGTLQQAEASS